MSVVWLYPIESLAAVTAVTYSILVVHKHGVAKLLRMAAWLLWRTAEAWERGWSAAVVGFRSVGAE